MIKLVGAEIFGKRLYHGGQNIRQSTRKLKHDDYNGHGYSHDSTGVVSALVNPMIKCTTDLRAAAAPKKAYVPGVIQGTSG
jgi:hypothetical protein